MQLKPITYLVTLPAVTLLVAGSLVVSAFSRMPPAENVLGISAMYEVAENEANSPTLSAQQELAMLEIEG